MRLRRHQADTVSTTIPQVMRRRLFRQGIEDLRAGRPPRFDDFEDSYWAYERGRQWAVVAPKTMPVMIGTRVNPKAVAVFVTGGIL